MSNALTTLAQEIEAHLRQMAPHQRERKTAQLLERALNVFRAAEARLTPVTSYCGYAQERTQSFAEEAEVVRYLRLDSNLSIDQLNQQLDPVCTRAILLRGNDCYQLCLGHGDVSDLAYGSYLVIESGICLVPLSEQQFHSRYKILENYKPNENQS
jgi:hypothetical protein